MRYKNNGMNSTKSSKNFKVGKYLNGTKSIEFIAILYVLLGFLIAILNTTPVLTIFIFLITSSQLFTLSLANLLIMLVSTKDWHRYSDLYTFIATFLLLCITLNFIYYVAPTPSKQPEYAELLAHYALFQVIITAVFYSYKNFFLPKGCSSQDIYFRLSIFVRPFYFQEHLNEERPINAFLTTRKHLLRAWFIFMTIILVIGFAFTYVVLNY